MSGVFVCRIYRKVVSSSPTLASYGDQFSKMLRRPYTILTATCAILPLCIILQVVYRFHARKAHVVNTLNTSIKAGKSINYSDTVDLCCTTMRCSHRHIRQFGYHVDLV